MKEKVASQVPGLAVVRTRRELAWISPCVSKREVGIVNLVIELGRNGRARDPGRHVSVLRSRRKQWRVSVRCGKLGRGGSVQPRALPSARRDNWSDNAQPQSHRHNLGSGHRAKIKYTVIILQDARSCFGFRSL